MTDPLRPRTYVLQSAASTTMRKRPDPLLAEASPAPRPVRLTKMDRGRAWLSSYLTMRGGSAESAAVKGAAALAGISASVLYEASKGLVKSTSIAGTGHRTVWSLAANPSDAVSATSKAAAQAWLIDHLQSTADGCARSRDVKAAAEAVGHSPKTVSRARVALGIISRSVPGIVPRQTEWLLPGSAGGMSPRTTLDAAEVWLADYLYEHGGRVESGEVKRAGELAGHHVKTLQRARKRAAFGVETIPSSFPRRTEWFIDQ